MKFAEPPTPRDQILLIPTSLEDVIPPNHTIRVVDELLDLLDWSAFTEKFRYNRSGRPPIHPKILAAIWIWAFIRRIHSSRLLEQQLKVNVEFMWLSHGFDLDHSTLANFRKSNAEGLKKIHIDLVRKAKDLGLIKIGEMYVDATRIKADSNRFSVMTADKAEALIQLIDQQIEDYHKNVSQSDQNDAVVEDLIGQEIDGENLPGPLADLTTRRQKLLEMQKVCQEADEVRRKQSIDPKKNPFQLPLNDPDSRILPNKEGGYAPNYTPLVSVEGELGLIIQATIFNGTQEHDHLVGAVDWVEDVYGVVVTTVAADAGYSTGYNIKELEYERGKDFVAPHRNGDPHIDNPAIREDLTLPLSVSEAERLPRASNGKFSNEAFVYDATNDQMYCPAGKAMPRAYKEMTPRSNGESVEKVVYQSPSCDGCPLVEMCRGKQESGKTFKTGRRVMRDAYEDNRSEHRKKMSTPEAKSRYQKRLSLGERCFGYIKQNLGLRRFHCRGQSSVESEFRLAVLAQNLVRITSCWPESKPMRTTASSQG